jgi:predicted lipoprotein with Yx(FWY)xxD motif
MNAPQPASVRRSPICWKPELSGVSNCYDGCASSWPPFVAAEGAAEGEGFTLVERTDGSMQWAYGDMPLYFWAGDSAPGDMTGDGVGGVWHVVK